MSVRPSRYRLEGVTQLKTDELTPTQIHDVEGKLKERHQFMLIHDPLRNGSVKKVLKKQPSQTLLEDMHGEELLKKVGELAAKASALDSQAAQIEKFQRLNGPSIV